MSRLVDQIREALHAFAGCGTPPALIGGLALAAHHVVRATQDVDLLADSADAGRLHDLLLGLGYRCIHRSADAANYLRGDEGLDLLYAHRPVARRLLVEAEERDTAMGRLHVISAEGLIGFKLQGYVNDPTCSRDLDDIRALLRANRTALNMPEVREYFGLSERDALLEKYSAKSTADAPQRVQEPPLAASGGVAYARPGDREPIGAWMDLMEVVEALCPRWPNRPVSGGQRYLL